MRLTAQGALKHKFLSVSIFVTKREFQRISMRRKTRSKQSFVKVVVKNANLILYV